MQKLHSFNRTVSIDELPQQFNCPFCYVPHNLCVEAAAILKEYLSSDAVLAREADKGKMFGVLVVEDKSDGRIGFLAAFSGLLAGKSIIPYFVPPVYDLTSPDGFFRQEEKNISDINSRIKELEHSEQLAEVRRNLSTVENERDRQLSSMRWAMKDAKKQRDIRRREGVSAEEEAAMIRESQFQKAEYKRLERAFDEQIAKAREAVDEVEQRIAALKSERKHRSASLQMELFRHFSLLNGMGEVCNLVEIFNDHGIATPPSGSGECAAPKLLNYAFMHNLRPVAMAEFWIGDSPKSEIRVDGCFYPSCSNKCGPILDYMLRGVDTEPNPLEQKAGECHAPEVIYEDASLIVVAKPAGMLTVPGKIAATSLYEYITRRYPDISGPAIVHRLDMSTSGLVVIARNKDVHEALQRQFSDHSIVKHYYAILDGTVGNDRGIISLPLCADINDRPRQMVSFEMGKEAITEYEVLERKDGTTRILFKPLTGRTHQLRVHSASSSGLGVPIKGDAIYGTMADRLYLHAGYLEFTHPVTGEHMHFEDLPEF